MMKGVRLSRGGRARIGAMLAQIRDPTRKSDYKGNGGPIVIGDPV
jgi:hypothetical protein